MIVPTRFLVWLMLPMLALCSSNLLANTVEGAPQALHLIDYIGADYPATVADGKVIDETEYHEQLEFLTALQKLIVALPARAERAELEQGVAALRQAISDRQDGSQVARQARQLGARLAVAYEVSQAPAITPDPARGAPLYAQQCSVCHGENGAGDGPAGSGMTPPPANLRDVARLDRLSLYGIYNTLTLGVEGTDMPSFADQLDERQRWDLATYIASFSAAPVAKTDKAYNIADLARQTPGEIQAAEGDEAAALFRAQRAQPPQVKRGPSQLLDYTATTLDKSLAAYRAGDREQAYDLSVAAYLEGFELVESSLDNVDANVRKDTEKSLMAYRQSLQDGLPVEQVEQRLAFAKDKLKASAGLLGNDGLSQSLSFISGLLILLREGLEAILVLAAILAFLRNTGQQSAVRSVNIGWGLALLAGAGGLVRQRDGALAGCVDARPSACRSLAGLHQEQPGQWRWPFRFCGTGVLLGLSRAVRSDPVLRWLGETAAGAVLRDQCRVAVCIVGGVRRAWCQGTAGGWDLRYAAGGVLRFRLAGNSCRRLLAGCSGGRLAGDHRALRS